VTNRGGKGVKTINITAKTGKLIAIKNVNDDNDLVIINKSGIAIRLKVSSLRVVGRATQGVRLINLEKKNDEIASVCKVDTEPETTDEESVRDAFSQEDGAVENLNEAQDIQQDENEQQNDNE
jgi:DNA gyrase subunit A